MFFILGQQQNGIKLKGINRKVKGVFQMLKKSMSVKKIGIIFFTMIFILLSNGLTNFSYADPTPQSSQQTNTPLPPGTKTFAQPLQNTNVTLSGTSVRTTMYFTKIDYWNVKKATFNMTYAITQLRNDEDCNITFALNGIKFYSFKPTHHDGQQTVNVDIPLDLLQDSNVLTVEGQIITKGQCSRPVATPANWLTLYGGSNVNFTYTLNPPTDQIHSFYNHFIGADTIANHESTILVPSAPTDDELEAATYALAGVSRVITTENAKMNLNNFDNKNYNDRPYQLIMALYKDLPKNYQKEIDPQNVENGNAYMKFINGKNKILIVTAQNGDALVKAGRYVANQELMQETNANTKQITAETQTFTPELQSEGNYPLTGNNTKLIGPGHQQQVFFVALPHDQNNAEGSYVNLNFRYSKNLDFKTSLITVYVNGKPVGSKDLTAAKANDDSLQVKIPNNTKLSNACTITVAFDLNMKNGDSNNSQTPWAYIENNSNAFIKTTGSSDLLFQNYPLCFMADHSFNNIGVQLPEKMNDDYFNALTNIFNLIGSYSESNVGDITFYQKEMSSTQISSHNVIIMGTPDDTPLVRKFNKQLFFKYNKNFTTFLSNEKLSIESEYGKHLGTVQLMFNPYNKNNAMLVVTGVNAKDVQVASTLIDTEAHAGTLKGDGAVMDTNGVEHCYRFKKKVNNKEKVTLIKRIKSNPYFAVYLFMGMISVVVIGIIIFLFIRKNFMKGRKKKDE